MQSISKLDESLGYQNGAYEISSSDSDSEDIKPTLVPD
jgi:hypothetical protein